jgi:hypothetical protein
MRDAAERILLVHSALLGTLASAYPDHQIVYVDDGSRDATWSLIEKLATDNPAVIGVRLRGHGQVAALQAGFDAADGAVVAAMDDDLEIDPKELVSLVDALGDDVDFASARRTGPRSAARTVGSIAFNRRLRRWGYPFEDVGCAFMAMKARVARDLAAQGDLIRGHRFKPAVVARGHRIVEIPLPSVRTTDSHFGINHLAASWFDVEATLRPTVMLGLCWLGVAAVAAGLVGAVVGAATGSWTAVATSALIGLIGVLLAAVGLVANQVLGTLRRLEQGRPDVWERTGQHSDG